MIAFATAGVVFVQPAALYAVPNGTTTAPATPGLPLWTWAADGFPSILRIVNFQQTDPDALTVILAVPRPLRSPVGVSARPVSRTLNVFDDVVLPNAAAAVAATTAVTASATSVTRRTRMFPPELGVPARGQAPGRYAGGAGSVCQATASVSAGPRCGPIARSIRGALARP